MVDQTDPNREDDFNGDNLQLVNSIEALLSLDDAKALIPHGLGGPGSHAYKLLAAAARRLVRVTPIDYRLYNTVSEALHTIEAQRREIAVLRPKAEAYDVIARMWRDQGGLHAERGYDVAFDLRRMQEQLHAEMCAEKEKGGKARDPGAYRDSGDMTEEQAEVYAVALQRAQDRTVQGRVGGLANADLGGREFDAATLRSADLTVEQATLRND